MAAINTWRGVHLVRARGSTLRLVWEGDEMHANGGLSTFLAAGDASMLQETRAGALALAGGARRRLAGGTSTAVPPA